MSDIKEANIGPSGNKYVSQFVDIVAEEVKARFLKLKDSVYYTLPIQVMRDEKPELFKALSSFSFQFGEEEEDEDDYYDTPDVEPDHPTVKWFDGKDTTSLKILIRADWFNEKPDESKERVAFSFDRREYDPLYGGLVSHASVTGLSFGSVLTLHMNMGATPSQFVKYFEHGTRKDWQGFESFRSILDHEALHIFDYLRPRKVQDTYGKQPYFNPGQSHDAEDLIRYFIQPLEFRAWMVSTIRDLETSYKLRPNDTLEDHLENSTAWGRLSPLRNLYKLLKSGATPKEPESGIGWRVGGDQEVLNQLHLKAGRQFNNIKRRVLKNVPKMYRYVSEWHSRKQNDTTNPKLKPKTLKSFDDIDYHKDIVSKRRVSEGEDYIDFQTHDELNPKLWDGETLNTDVREKLLKIAKAFHTFLNVKAKLRDVIMTGSSSNYNYSDKFSDIDLHLLYDFDDVLSEDEEDEDTPIENEADLVKEFMMAKKTIWNEKFDITINGIEVELYAQDIDEPHEANGQFSIAKNDWIKKPEKIAVELDEKSADAKAKELMDLIDHNLKGDPSDSTIQKLKDKIKKLRQIGLEKEDGEYSVENLAFKILRRSGYIEKLWDSEVESQEKEFSL